MRPANHGIVGVEAPFAAAAVINGDAFPVHQPGTEECQRRAHAVDVVVVAPALSGSPALVRASKPPSSRPTSATPAYSIRCAALRRRQPIAPVKDDGRVVANAVFQQQALERRVGCLVPQRAMLEARGIGIAGAGDMPTRECIRCAEADFKQVPFIRRRGNQRHPGDQARHPGEPPNTLSPERLKIIAKGSAAKLSICSRIWKTRAPTTPAIMTVTAKLGTISCGAMSSHPAAPSLPVMRRLTLPSCPLACMRANSALSKADAASMANATNKPNIAIGSGRS